MLKIKKLIRNVLAVCAIMFMSAVLCGAGCSNVAGGSGSGGGGGWNGITMVSITGGTVHMSASYTPTVSNFYMSETEITQKQWKEVVGNDGYGTSKPSDTYGNGDNFPMYYVNWYDTIVFCNKLSVKEGRTPCYKKSSETDTAKWGDPPSSNDATWNAITCDWTANGYRLPTEAEWEYAARAGNTSTSGDQYGNPATSSNLGDYAWYNANSGSKTHEVKKKSSNNNKLYDMHGNVREWCWDWYASYSSSSPSDPRGPSSGSSRVNRGGSWSNDTAICAVSSRVSSAPSYRSNVGGFRVVRRP